MAGKLPPVTGRLHRLGSDRAPAQAADGVRVLVGRVVVEELLRLPWYLILCLWPWHASRSAVRM